MVKILHLIAPTGMAGAERVILNHLTCHDRDRFDATVLVYVNWRRQSNSFTEELERQGIAYRKVLLQPHRHVAVLRETARMIREFGADLIHSHGYRSDVTGFLVARWTGLPIVTTVHGWTAVTWKVSMYERVDRWLLRFFDGIICASGELARSLADGGCGRKKVRLIHNAVQLRDSAGADRDDRNRSCSNILFVGRLSREKGVDFLLSAFSQHFSADSGVKLVIVGDGPLREELSRHAEASGLGDRAVFTGYRSDVDLFYRSADLLVLPSRTEGLPMVVLEAMQFGVPVVATDVGGIPEVIADGFNGILVKHGDTDALGQAMRKVLYDRDLAETLAVNSRNRLAERFSVDRWARDVEQFYEEIIRTGKGATIA